MPVWGHPHRAAGSSCAELIPQVVQFSLQRDHLLAEMHDSRCSGQVDAKVLHETTYSLHVFDVSFGIEPAASSPSWLEETALFVPPQRPFVNAAASSNHRDGVAWLVPRAIVEHPIGDGHAERLSSLPLCHQDDRSCPIRRNSS
jgi:hypothetical protein